MTDNFEHNEHSDDFNEHELGVHEEGAPRTGMAGNLHEAWRTRPIFKFMALIFAIFIIGIVGFNFLGSKPANDLAHLSMPPNIKEAPGGAVSPYMRQQTELANSERSQQAMANGGSAVPTPIGQTTDVGGFGAADKKDETLNELRAETEQLKQQVQQQQVQQAQQQQQPKQPEQFDNSLAEAMQRQMQQMLDGWTPKGIKEVTVQKLDDLKSADVASLKPANADAAAAAAQSTQPPRKILVAAGTVSYAQLMTEANSDVPGPILAQIVSGPLAGARAIGAFQVSQGYEQYLVLQFSIADKKGKDYKINAIALDPDTTLGGMATEVDERYFVRVILPAAAGFLQGMGQALGQGQSSIVTDGQTTVATTTGNGFKQGIYNGMGNAANTAGQFFQDQANLTKPLVRVAAGTPMGIFFTAPVYDTDIASESPPTAQQTGGYPGTNINGYGNPNGYGAGYGNPNGGFGGAGYGSANASPYPNYGGNGTNAASGVPYPNYASPSNAYVNSGVTRQGSPVGLSGVYGGPVAGYGQ